MIMLLIHCHLSQSNLVVFGEMMIGIVLSEVVKIWIYQDFLRNNMIHQDLSVYVWLPEPSAQGGHHMMTHWWPLVVAARLALCGALRMLTLGQQSDFTRWTICTVPVAGSLEYMGGSWKGVTPIAGWFIRENPIETICSKIWNCVRIRRSLVKFDEYDTRWSWKLGRTGPVSKSIFRCFDHASPLPRPRMTCA